VEPRFWFSISPEAPQTNYAQVIVQVSDKEATPKLIGPLQAALNKQVPGAWITVRQLQTNPVETPVEILISGQADTDPRTESQDIQTLRTLASQVMKVVGQSRGVAVLRDDWAPDSPQVKIEIDPDRANVVGITNADVANLVRSPRSAEHKLARSRKGTRVSRLLPACARRTVHNCRRSRVSMFIHRGRTLGFRCFLLRA